MALFIDLGLPLLVMFMMAVAGLGLRIETLYRCVQRPALVGTVLGMHCLILPAGAVLLIRSLELPSETAAALILVAAAPVGGLAIYYTLLAHADSALAAALTAISILASAVTMPVISWAAFRVVLHQAAGLTFPIGAVFRQTMVALFAPVAAGMLIRSWAPEWTARRIAMLRKASFVVLWLILAALLWDHRQAVQAQFGLVWGTAVLFSLFAAGTGWACGRFCVREAGGHWAVLFTFPARNIGVVVLVASHGLGRPDIASFAGIFLVAQIALLATLALCLAPSLRRVAETGTRPE